jgi:hypothetical protein
MLEFCNSSRKGGDNVIEVVAGICGGTEWITKEACASRDFGRSVPWLDAYKVTKD